MKKRLLVTLLIIAFNLSADSIVRTINVVGKGEIDVKPDTVVITTGVESADPTIGAALKENSTIMSTIFEGLADLGIIKEDIQTNNYSVYLYKPYDKNNKENEEYRVSNSINIKVRNMNLVDVIIDTLISLGANRINGVYFTYENENQFELELRKRAVENARSKAEYLAELENLKITGVISISEYGLNPTENRNYEYAMASPMAKGSIASGMETITASYNIVYQVTPK